MLGLVLEGGASRTVFSCGVLDAFNEANIVADYVIGTSAGIAYGVSYCSNQRGRNLRITDTFMEDRRYMGVQHLLGKAKCYYNLDFVYDEIPNKLLPFDYEAFSKFKGSCVAVVTNIATGKAEYCEMPRDDKKFMFLRASCALPILFPPIEIGGKSYMDGGICDSIPYQRALDCGCDKLIVVLTRERGYLKHQEKIAPLITSKYKQYPAFVKAFLHRPENYNQQISQLLELERQGKALLIFPPSTHEIGRTERRRKILVPYHLEGYDYTRRLIPQIREFLQN